MLVKNCKWFVEIIKFQVHILLFKSVKLRVWILWLLFSLAYADGVQLPSNSLIYGHLPIGRTIYFNNFTCPNGSASITKCSGSQVVSTPQCYSGELDYIFQCTSMLLRFIYTLSVYVIASIRSIKIIHYCILN